MPADARMTVQTYLQQWLADKKPSLHYKSYHHYEIEICLHLIPRIGKVPLAKLTPSHLNQIYAAMLDEGYSHTSVRLVHRLIKQALIHVVKLDILVRNVALLTTPPKSVSRDMIFLSRDEAKRLLDAARGTRLEAMWILALSTGMLLGELLALQWANVNLKHRTIRITKTLSRRPAVDGGLTLKQTKTESSTRTIPITAEVAETLRLHRACQAQERLIAGPVWIENDLVFCN